MPTRVFIERPTLVAATLAVVVLAGIVAMLTLTVQQFPNTDFPTVTVTANYSGASPSEMQDSIVRPIEDELAGAPQLTHLQSTIQSGTATISAQFDLSSNITRDLVEVQRRVQAAQAQLPSDLTTPTVSAFDPSEATIVTLALSSETLTAGQLSSLATSKIEPAIQQVTGVGNVQTSGNVTPSIQVEVNPDLLSALGATLNDVISAIANNNVRAPGGYVYRATRETAVNVRGDITDPASVGALLLPTSSSSGSSSSGSASSSPFAWSNINQWTASQQRLRISDVATITDGYEPQRIFAYVHGRPAITVQVQKAAGASEVAAAKAVLRAVPQLHSQFPQVHFDVISDESKTTVEQVRGVEHTLFKAMLLVAVVMLLFLQSWRHAAVVLISMPTSLLITFDVMKLAGFTIDIVSLMAMTLVVGILVDDSIVVLENITRHRLMEEAPKTAALQGRLEIGLAAVVLTLVDVVVFLPIAFIPGISGRVLREFAYVVVTATLTSLLVSFTITPSLAANWSLLSQWRAPRLIRAFGDRFDALRRWYHDRALPWAMARPALVFGVPAVSLLVPVALVASGTVGFEFVPSQDQGQVFIQITFPEGTPVATTRDAVLAVERAVDATPDVEAETATAGSVTSSFASQTDGAKGQVSVYLKSTRAHSTNYWVGQFRELAQAAAPRATVLVVPATGIGGGVSQPIDYVITDRADHPERYAGLVADVLHETPGAASVSSSAANNGPQVDVSFDRAQARALDIGIGTAATAIRAASGGYQATQFETTGGLKDVQVIYPSQFQRSEDELRRIPLRTDAGDVIHAGDIARFDYVQAPSLLTRVDRQTVMHVTANVAPGAELSNVTRAFTPRLAQLRLPASVRVAPNTTGTQQNLSEVVSGIGGSLLVSNVLVFWLMVALFNSYRSPLIVMTTVPLAAIGAIGALALTHQTLNLFSLIGTVLLIGLVAKNGILLVDFANQRRLAGLDRKAAAREAAAERFRPIIMTTFAMVFGMLPLALGLERGSSTYTALGIVVIGGLLSSLFLSLFVVPLVYTHFAPRTVKAHTWE